MSSSSKWRIASGPALLAALAFAVPAASQTPATAGVMAELLEDVSTVEEKMVSLAQAIPADKFDWRPGEGVRSVGEVLMHVAADNFWLPTTVGVAAPAETGIGSGANSYPSVQAFEQREATRDEAIAMMQQSFAHVKKVMRETPEAKLDENVDLFGSTVTTRGMWILTTTHMHEHLGQLIAYARTNGVVPPWSQ